MFSTDDTIVAIAVIDRALFDLAARLAASLDFPEEGYHFVTPEETTAGIKAVTNRIDALLRDTARGRPLRDGRQAVICGRPDSCKYSLFNSLLGFYGAIVVELDVDEIYVNGFSTSLPRGAQLDLVRALPGLE